MYFCRFRAFTSRSCFVLNLLAIIKGAESIAFNIRVMHKQILTTIIWGYESVTFFRAKPLNCACCHVLYSFGPNRRRCLINPPKIKEHPGGFEEILSLTSK